MLPEAACPARSRRARPAIIRPFHPSRGSSAGRRSSVPASPATHTLRGLKTRHFYTTIKLSLRLSPAARMDTGARETSTHRPNLRARRFLFCRPDTPKTNKSHPIQEDYTLGRFPPTRVVTNSGYLKPFDPRTLPFVREFTPLVGYLLTGQDDGAEHPLDRRLAQDPWTPIPAGPPSTQPTATAWAAVGWDRRPTARPVAPVAGRLAGFRMRSMPC